MTFLVKYGELILSQGTPTAYLAEFIGAFSLFINKQRDKIKALFWGKTVARGLALLTSCVTMQATENSGCGANDGLHRVTNVGCFAHTRSAKVHGGEKAARQ